MRQGVQLHKYWPTLSTAPTLTLCPHWKSNAPPPSTSSFYCLHKHKLIKGMQWLFQVIRFYVVELHFTKKQLKQSTVCTKIHCPFWILEALSSIHFSNQLHEVSEMDISKHQKKKPQLFAHRDTTRGHSANMACFVLLFFWFKINHIIVRFAAKLKTERGRPFGGILSQFFFTDI